MGSFEEVITVKFGMMWLRVKVNCLIFFGC